MFSRWFQALIVAFWLGTMSWLVFAKVLPPLMVGEPPTYRAIVEDAHRHRAQAAARWHIFWNNEQVGSARTETALLPDDVTDLRSQVHFDHFPLAQMAPFRGASISQLLGGTDQGLALDARSSVTIDALKRPLELRSTLQVGLLDQAIEMRGRVEGDHLKLTVRMGEFVHHTQTFLPGEAILSDVLSPPARLPHLRVGQTWTTPIYSPFSAPNRPLEVLKAVVEREETIVWGGRGQRARVVVYRQDQGAGLGDSRSPRGRTWVLEDGTVVRQEATLLSATLRFELLPPEQSLGGAP